VARPRSIPFLQRNPSDSPGRSAIDRNIECAQVSSSRHGFDPQGRSNEGTKEYFIFLISSTVDEMVRPNVVERFQIGLFCRQTERVSDF
jgi:hypothetical protein